MTEQDKRASSQAIEIESTDRWVAGKGELELLSDLKVYLARLRDNPRSLVDRLRVAAIQLRLGRVQEALIHYEGVLRGYVAEGQIMSAIALCQRILGFYPDLPRIQRILAALYARAPRGTSSGPSAVTPISDVEDQMTSTFEVSSRVTAEDAEAPMRIDSIFPDLRQHPAERRGRELWDLNEDLRPTMPMERTSRESGRPIPLTQPKGKQQAEQEQEEPAVLLLTKHKPGRGKPDS